MSTKVSWLYVRVSTKDQVRGAESQTRPLTDWASKNNIQNFEIFADHRISGAKESRPALNLMMQKLEEGLVEQVVVFAFSRFARSTTHLLKTLEKFRERVIAGMKTAKAKGIRIGRVRKRNDVLIHSHLEAGLSYREVARIAKCSH